MPKPHILPEVLAYKAGMLSAQAQAERLQAEVHAQQATRLGAELASLLKQAGVGGAQRVVLVAGAQDPEGHPLAIGTVIDAQGRAVMLPDPKPEEKMEIPLLPDTQGELVSPSNGVR